MKQREIQDGDGTAWTCVQAFTGGESGAAQEAQARTERGGKVSVVCTPSGGERTVRLRLGADWMDGMPDADLLGAIAAARDEAPDASHER